MYLEDIRARDGTLTLSDQARRVSAEAVSRCDRSDALCVEGQALAPTEQDDHAPRMSDFADPSRRAAQSCISVHKQISRDLDAETRHA